VWVAFGAALLCGIWLTHVAGPVIVAIGVASILSGLAYTGGPYPLGYNGLGDVFVLVFFGFVAVAGTAFVASGHVPGLAWLAAVPIGALATAVLVVNNARDMSTDARVGKHTLAVRFGRRFANFEYAALLGAAYGAVTAAVLTGLAPVLALISLLPAPWAVSLAQRFMRTEGAALNPLLPMTAKLLLATAALLAVGIAFGAP
jgi:1,4-dihydroxy-2-naphthoate octaprenyltransferase